MVLLKHLVVNCFCILQLEFDAHDMGDRLFLLYPLVLTHRITETSPLWTLRPDDLVFDKFEVRNKETLPFTARHTCQQEAQADMAPIYQV